MLKEKLKKNSQKELLDGEKAYEDEVKKPSEEEEGDSKEENKEDFDKMRRDFDDEKSRYMSEKMEFEAAQALSREDLPTSFAKLVKGRDEKETAQNVAEFKEAFMAEVEKAVMEKMRGQTPKTGMPSKNNDPFLSGFSK